MSTQFEIVCIPNFSEGRETKTALAITEAIQSTSAILMEFSMDADHNRCVAAFVGDVKCVVEAALKASEVAVKMIDLRTHEGQHPRFGAVDVIPLVPLQGVEMNRAVDASIELGERLAKNLGIPIYLYEQSATSEFHKNLVSVRRLGAAGLDAKLVGALRPNYGPEHFHPTAGACAVGARQPLVAYNMNLHTNISKARLIASEMRDMREAGEGFQGVKAMGVELKAKGISQVSTNVTQPDVFSPRQVFNYVQQRAADMGIRFGGSELVGIVSRRHLPQEDVDAMNFEGLKETQFVEHWTNGISY